MGQGGSTSRRNVSRTTSPPRGKAPQTRRQPSHITRSASNDNVPSRQEPARQQPRRRRQQQRRGRQHTDLRVFIAVERARQRARRRTESFNATSGGLAWSVGVDNRQVNAQRTSDQQSTSRQPRRDPARRNAGRLVRSASNDNLSAPRRTQQTGRSLPRIGNGRQMFRSSSTENVQDSRTIQRQPLQLRSGRSNSNDNISNPRPVQRNSRQVTRSSSNDNLPVSRSPPIQTRANQRVSRSPPIRTRANQRVSRSPPIRTRANQRVSRSPPIRTRANRRVWRSPQSTFAPVLNTLRRIARSSSSENLSTSRTGRAQRARGQQTRSAQRQPNPSTPNRGAQEPGPRSNPRRNVRQIVRSNSDDNLPATRSRNAARRDNIQAWIAEARRARRMETESTFASGGMMWTVGVDTHVVDVTSDQPPVPVEDLPDATLHQGDAPPTYQEAVTNSYFKTLPGNQADQNEEQENQSETLPPSYEECWP